MNEQAQRSPSDNAEEISGVVTRIGSTVWDGSVRRQLEKIREKLAAGQ